MPPKGSASTKLQPMRLPPLQKLRVRRPNQADANPCLSIMSSVLSMFLLWPTLSRLRIFGIEANFAQLVGLQQDIM